MVISAAGANQFVVDPNSGGQTDVILYSKFIGGMWPHHAAVADRIGKLADLFASGHLQGPYDFGQFQFNPTSMKKNVSLPRKSVEPTKQPPTQIAKPVKAAIATPKQEEH